jgi:uncharacterized protein DUF5675
MFLQRRFITPESTEGVLTMDTNALQFYTLELPVKDGMPGSAIPEGTYPVIINWSPKFGHMMPLLTDIPMRSEIRIHFGNDEADTEGCILVGNTWASNFVGQSREAFSQLYPLIEAAANNGGCSITVSTIGQSPSPDAT